MHGNNNKTRLNWSYNFVEKFKVTRRIMKCNFFILVVVVIVSLAVTILTVRYDSHSQPIYPTNSFVMSIRQDVTVGDNSSQVACETGRPCSYPEVVDIRIIVITYNRPASLQKLLTSLDTLVLDDHRAALEIWIDRNRKSGLADNKTVNIAKSFRWRGGPTRVHIQGQSAGILGQWIDTWRPPQSSPDSELALILEDDISVSKFAVRWLIAVHRKFGNRTDFAGASLTSDQMSILSAKPKGRLSAPKNHTVLMYKIVGSWGFSPKPSQWARFQDWYHQNKPSVNPKFHPYVPGILPTIWYKEMERSGTAHTMWTMWFIYFMNMNQLYTVYNNLRVYTNSKDACLCINRREVGLHVGVKGPENLCRLMTVWKDEYVNFPSEVVRLDYDGTPMGNKVY